jgi:hypothetical protein
VLTDFPSLWSGKFYTINYSIGFIFLRYHILRWFAIPSASCFYTSLATKIDFVHSFFNQ